MEMRDTSNKTNELRKKMRIRHLLLFLLLLAEEIYIGVCVRDHFVRPYVGDFLVVILLYFFVRIFCLRRPTYLSLWIFLFALVVEFTQIFPLADLLGIKNQLIRVLMGTSFAWKDVIAYALGSLINFLWDRRIKEKGKG